MTEQQNNQNAVGFWQVVILVLSVYVLLALALELVLALPPQVLILLGWIDFAICIVFIVDFFRDFGKTVAWEVDKIKLVINQKKIHSDGFAGV